MAAQNSQILGSSDDVPIKRTLLKVQIVELLRSRIIFGHIAPGTPLVERELAEVLHCSRLPVREALQELEKEGLVISTTGNRRYVIELTAKDIVELYAVRLQLELLAVELAARNTNPDHQAELNQMLAEMEDAYRSHDDSAFPRADVNLHLAIWKQAGNSHLNKLLQSMAGQLFMFAAKHSRIFAWEEVVDLHRDLIDHINTGDVINACKSIEKHTQNSLDRALKAFIPNSEATSSEH
jgi:DNA-binding GntR family transcriptional regulator